METQLILAAPVAHKIGWNPAKMRSVLRSPIKSHGGKFYLSESILAVMSPALSAAHVWHEPCAGGANTWLQASRRGGVVQIVNDADPLIANVWRVFSTEPLALRLLERLREVKAGTRDDMERNFLAASTVCATRQIVDFEGLSDDWRVGLAAATIVNSRMSRGGMGKNFAWQERDRGGQPGEVNSWQTFVWNHAPRVVERCRNWFALCRDALDLADPATSPDGGVANTAHLYYYDPPYVKTTRTAPNVYRVDGFDHVRFIRIVRNAPARIAISGYANELYATELTPANGWTRHEFHIVNHAGQNKKKGDRVENLWTNF